VRWGKLRREMTRGPSRATRFGRGSLVVVGLSLDPAWVAHVWAEPVSVVQAAAVVQVDGSAVCPTPSEVAGRLDGILADSAAAATAGTRAHIRRTEGDLWVALRDEAGSMLAERRLAATGSCAELASAAAVVIASWIADVHAEPPLPAVEIAATPPVPVPPAVSPSAVVNVTTIVMSAGAVASAAGGHLALGGLLDATATLRAFPVGVRVAFLANTSRKIELAPGRVSWRRIALSLGPAYEVVLGALAMQLQVDGSLALLTTKGTGYEVDRSVRQFDAAVSGGLRVAWARLAVAPWIGTGATLWPGRVVYVGGLEKAASLPRVEIFVSAGASFGRH